MTGLENTTLYNEDMKGIAISSASFELFIREDALYVDKTRYIYNLVKNPARNFCFISRPRSSGRAFSAILLRHSSKETRNYSRGFTSMTSMISNHILFFISISTIWMLTRLRISSKG